MTSRPIARRSLLALLGAAVLAPQPASAYVDTVNGVEVIVNGLDPKPRSRDAGALPAPKHESASAQQAHVGGGTPVAVAPAYDPIAARAIVYAEKFIGVPYVWGGTSPSGFDCSGFVQFVFNAVGVPIPRTADVQFAWGRPVAGFPIPGDLVFFQTYAPGASHVGLYLGGGWFVNSVGTHVQYSSFASSYFRDRYLGARRVIPSA